MKEIRFKKQRWARGTSRPKLDLRLATLVELGPAAFGDQVDRLERKRHLSRGGALAFLGGDLLGSPHEAAKAPPFASVFVTAESPDALDRLEKKLADAKTDYRSGTTRLLSKAGNIATAEVALDDLKRLEDEPDVTAIEWTGAFRPLSDDGDGAGDVLSPRASIGLDGAPAEIDGKGTIIGIVDVEGLDFYHPCFISDSGTTRVLALWDQRASKPTVVPGEEAPENGLPRKPYGRVYGREALQHEVLPSQPEPYSEVPHIAWKSSHGTKTAGLAMGLAWDRPEARGVAPGADLVFVGTFSSGVGALGSMAEMADALAFVFEVADAKKRPCVVNVSMGDDLGPRDGASPVERFIDQLVSKPGRAVVVAAGNSAQKRHHRKVALEDGQTSTVELDVGERNTDRIALEIWYPAAEEGESVEVEIEAPGDGNRTGRIPPDGKPRAFDCDKTRILVASASKAAGAEPNGFIRLEILGISSAEPLVHGTWKVHLTARGAPRVAHAWIDHRYVRFAGSGDEETTLTTPATSCKAITVGAYDVGRKEPYSFSGKGPCRGAHPKPDILAPGGPLWVPSAMTAVRYVSATGTSMAAPLVTGAVALVFQRYGMSLRSDQVLSKLLPPSAGQAATGGDVGVLDLSYFLAQTGEAASGFEAEREDVGASHYSPTGPGPKVAGDRQQIMAGIYIVFQPHGLVGYLLVTEEEGPGRTVERWLLRKSYEAPSARTPRTELRFRHIAAPMSVQDFLSHHGKGAVSYIRAECTAFAWDRTKPLSAYRAESFSTKDTFTFERKHTMNPSKTRPNDAVQIMAGWYILRQADEQVGKLFVEDLTSPGASREHWLLYSSYQWPSSDFPNQSIQFVKQTTTVTLSGFLDGAPSTATYIIANCQKQ